MDEKNEKRSINQYLKLIFEKSQETILIQQLEKLIKKNYKGNSQKEKEEYLIKFLHIIKTEIFESQYKKYIIHGDMTIFYSIFCMFKSLGLNNEHILFFEVIEPLFEFFQKKDGKIVCTSVNILIKMIRGNKNFILKYFNYIFDKLIILILRKEIEIRNSGYFLDEIMKNDIGTIFQENYSEKNEKIKLNLKSIIDYLIKKLDEDMNYPALDILIVSWFDFFETMPKINLFNNYTQIIPKLFQMLSSKAKEEISSSEFCLKKIIKNIDILYEDLIKEDSKIIFQILETIINNCYEIEISEQIKKCSFELLEIFLKKYNKIMQEYYDYRELFPNEENINNSTLSKINDSSSDDENKEKEKTEKKSIVNKELVRIKSLIHFKLFPNILEVIIQNTIINSNRPIIYNQINKCNSIFMSIMDMFKKDYFYNIMQQNFCFQNVIIKYIKDSQINEININLLFDWISLLYEIKLFFDEEYLEHLMFRVPEINEINILRILEILNKISLEKKCIKFNKNIIEIIIQKLNESPEMINSFGILILKKLVKSINVITLFEEMSGILLENKDIYFVLRMINLFNKFLIMEDEAHDIRNLLSKFGNEIKSKSFFKKLFSLWSFNPFCTLILVLLSNNFELGYSLIKHISKMKLKAEDYIELGQVVQVFESSVFNHVRIKLLNPKKFAYLIKTLYAILLLLPQGQAFDSLNTRLRCLEIIHNLDDNEDEEEEEEEDEDEEEEEKEEVISNINETKHGEESSKLSNKLFKNSENDFNKIFLIEKKNGEVIDKETYQNKTIKDYDDIFIEAQRKKKDFEDKINESGQIRQVCYSPIFHLNRNNIPKDSNSYIFKAAGYI